MLRGVALVRIDVSEERITLLTFLARRVLSY
jgi:hypothetical protein